jgi:uncharacterized protein
MDQTDLPNIPAHRTIDAQTEHATRCFLQHVAARYRVREAIVFGSRARGTHRVDSDLDLAIVLDGAQADRTAAALDMAGVAFTVLMETGVMVDALPLWNADFESTGTFRNRRLLKHIRRDGVRL